MIKRDEIDKVRGSRQFMLGIAMEITSKNDDVML